MKKLKPMSKRAKTVLIGTGVFLLVVVGVMVVYTVNKPIPTPIPTPTPQAQITPEPVEINQVGTADACSLSFTVSATQQPVCNQACNETDLICPSNLECISGVCLNPSCTTESDCVCPGESPSPSPSPSPSDSPSVELDCVVKRAYEDDAQNAPGVYYLNTEITDTNTLSNGQVIVYNIVVANHGDGEVPETTIEDTLSDNLTYLDSSSGCTYDSASRKVTCSVGTIPGNTEASKSIRVQVTVAGTSSINNKADVFSTDGQRDICEITVSATGEIVQPPSPIPTALPEAGVMEVTTGTLGIGVLFLLLGGLGLLLI